MAGAEQQQAKRRVAERALDFVKDGMRVGLGTGSTAAAFVDLLGQRARAGLTVRCVPTSEATRRQAEALGLDVTTLDELPELDVTIDGADEVDPHLTLIKGGGGALLREKIVATASATLVVIADGAKMVDRLGAFPLPVEVNRFGLAATTRLVRQVIADTGHAGEIRLRSGQDGQPFATDGGHLILDCHLSAIHNPVALGAGLWAVPGVVEHGLFIGIATAVVTERDGAIVVIQPNP